MKTDFLVEWIKTATVLRGEGDYEKSFVATKGNERLFLHAMWPKGEWQGGSCTTLVWVKDGKSKLLFQSITRDGHVIHSTGNLTGEYGVSENLETIWVALVGSTGDR